MSNTIFNIYELPGDYLMYQVDGQPAEIIAMLASALENEQIYQLVFGAVIMHADRHQVDLPARSAKMLAMLKTEP
jgi:hypothetical protein